MSDLSCPGLVVLVVAGSPLVVGPQGCPWVASPGSSPLASANDETEYVADGSDNTITHQKEFFKTAGNSVNAVFEIGLNPLPGVVGHRGVIGLGMLQEQMWRIARVEIDVGLIGEEPVHRNQDKVSVEFLLHSTLSLGMEIFDDKKPFADFVEFLNAPSGVIDLHQRVQRIAVTLDQGCAKTVRVARNLIFDEPHLQRNDVQLRMLLFDVASC